jgi:hypothetical protein
MGMIARRRQSSKARRLQREFDQLAPWITKFEIDGVEYGGSYSYATDERIRQFRDAFPHARAILELGSLEGGQTFRLAEIPDSHVTAAEGRPENVRKARFVQHQLGVSNVRFVDVNLEGGTPTELGTFDAIFCSGVVYHLPSPGRLLDSLRTAAPGVFIWTHYADTAETEHDGLPGRWYSEGDNDHPLSGLSPQSFFVTRDGLVERLRQSGFASVEILDDRPDHDPFACVTLVGRADSASASALP